MTFPGPRPVTGDAAVLTTGTAVLILAGAITSQGVLRDGCGFAELTWPDADPQQRRDLERAGHFQYDLYRDGQLLYSSPNLTVRGTRRTRDGSLVITGSP
ncbi:hypothetical protein AB0I84_47935 [Streptomyces spectabilis]|uniref:hypothetical protein n=1 Tax=Streptomyces spectabilis TaxID=68270 RepID=UPI0033EDC6CF